MTPTTTTTNAGIPGINRFTPAQLLRTARLFATDPELETLVDTSTTQRSWRLLDSTAHLQIWLLAWPAGSSTGWHDHDEAAGAFLTVQGTLAEHSRVGGSAQQRVLGAGEGRPFGPRHVHSVANTGPDPALSLHVYSPALTQVTRYAVQQGRPRPVARERAGEDW